MFMRPMTPQIQGFGIFFLTASLNIIVPCMVTNIRRIVIVTTLIPFTWPPSLCFSLEKLGLRLVKISLL